MIMAVRKKKDILENEEGQALVEFLLFLPFMLIMYSITLSISNSINASINQQKVTRGYFYYVHQNTSMLPRANRSGVTDAWNTFGMSIIGWREQLVNNQPMATCFKFRVPLGDTEDDSCEQGYDKTTTQFIRVGTVYGICGATYRRRNTDIYNRILDSPVLVTSQDACHITQ